MTLQLGQQVDITPEDMILRALNTITAERDAARNALRVIAQSDPSAAQRYAEQALRQVPATTVAPFFTVIGLKD